MRHHTVTATFSAPADDVFAYLANIDNLPNWATDFARELKLVDGRHKVVNGLGEFFFEIEADRESGVIDMLAGPTTFCVRGSSCKLGQQVGEGKGMVGVRRGSGRSASRCWSTTHRTAPSPREWRPGCATH